MSATDRMFDVTNRDQGEQLVVITPTLDAAQTQAAGLIYMLRQDRALLNRVVAAVNNPSHGSIGTGLIRTNTVLRLAGILRKATEVELTVVEADVFADDIHDAMVPAPPCEVDGCDQPEHHQGLCWDHYNARQATVDARVRAAIASTPALMAKANAVLGGASA